MKLIPIFLALIIPLTAGAATQKPISKIISVSNATVTGELSFAAMQFWLTAGSETLCVMIDSADEEKIEPLVGKKVRFSGPIQVWTDKKRCIVVGPDFPTAIK